MAANKPIRVVHEEGSYRDMSNGNYREVSFYFFLLAYIFTFTYSCTLYKCCILHRLLLKGRTSAVPYRKIPLCLTIAAMRLTTGTYERISSE